MIITLSGVTGVGKSYLKNKIMNYFHLKNLIVVTTRKKRTGEINGKDKYFLTIPQYNKMAETGEISVTFNFLGENYAYYTSDLKSNENSITELHYTTITEFKKISSNVLSIYLIPSNVDIAIEKLKQRKLDAKIQKKRINEIKEQIKTAKSCSGIIKEFDYIIENDYTENTIKKIIEIIEENTANMAVC